MTIVPPFDNMSDAFIERIIELLAADPDPLTNVHAFTDTCRRMHALAETPAVWEHVDVGLRTGTFSEAECAEFLRAFGDRLGLCREFSHVQFRFCDWHPHICRMTALRKLLLTVDASSGSAGADLAVIAAKCPGLHTVNLTIATRNPAPEALTPGAFKNVRDLTLTCHPACGGPFLKAFCSLERLALHATSWPEMLDVCDIVDGVRLHASTLTELDVPNCAGIANALEIARLCPNLRKWHVDVGGLGALATLPPLVPLPTLVLDGYVPNAAFTVHAFAARWPGAKFEHVAQTVHVMEPWPHNVVEDVEVLHARSIHILRDCYIHRMFPNLREVHLLIAKAPTELTADMIASLLDDMVPPATGAAMVATGRQLHIRCRRPADAQSTRAMWKQLYLATKTRTVFDRIHIEYEKLAK